MGKLAVLLLVSTISVALLACSGGGNDQAATVAVTLKEWEVSAAPAEVNPGQVKFEVTNRGARPHQLIVVKSDLPLSQLPMTPDNLADISKLIVSGQIELIQPGSNGSAEIELFPGKYILICNLIDRPATGPADPHYLNGMATPFLVLDD